MDPSRLLEFVAGTGSICHELVLGERQGGILSGVRFQVEDLFAGADGVAGGVVGASILALYFVPSVYVWIQRRRLAAANDERAAEALHGPEAIRAA